MHSDTISGSSSGYDGRVIEVHKSGNQINIENEIDGSLQIQKYTFRHLSLSSLGAVIRKEIVRNKV